MFELLRLSNAVLWLLWRLEQSILTLNCNELIFMTPKPCKLWTYINSSQLVFWSGTHFSSSITRCYLHLSSFTVGSHLRFQINLYNIEKCNPNETFSVLCYVIVYEDILYKIINTQFSRSVPSEKSHHWKEK